MQSLASEGDLLRDGLGTSYAWDSEGHIHSIGGSYSWDADGRAVSIKGANVTYDALGRMVESGGNEVLYGPDGRKLALMNTAGGPPKPSFGLSGALGRRAS